MRTTLILVFLALSATAAPAAETAATRSWTHVRPLTRNATTLLKHAARRSPIVLAIMDDLEQSDLVVYLADSTPGEGRPPAYLTFVGHGAGTRYVLVRVEPWWCASPSDRIVQLAHELHHALEVARSPEVLNEATLAELYRRIGWEGEEGRFETDGAISVGKRVRNQLAGIGSASR